MSESQVIPENLNGNDVDSPQTKKANDVISWPKAVAILLVIVVALVGGGYALGKNKFWKTYDTTPKLDRQEALFNEKIAADPNNPDNYVSLGYVYFQKKDYEKAIANYKKALSLNDKHYSGHFNLGVAYQQTDKVDRAIQEFQKAIEIAPKAPAAHLSLGLAFKAKGEWDKANKELEEANKLNPGDSQVLYQLGTVKEKLGQKDVAIQIYQSAVDLLPSYEEAKQALQRLKSEKK